MPIPASEQHANGGVGAAAKQVAEHASSIARLELELAALELKKKVAALGIGIGLALGAALFTVFLVALLLAAVAAAFATFLATWLAILVTAGIVFLVVGALGTLALAAFKKGAPPVPEQAIHEAKLTSEALKR